MGKKKTTKKKAAKPKSNKPKRHNRKTIMPDRKTVFLYCALGIAVALLTIAYIEYDKRHRPVHSECDYCQQAAAPISSSGSLDDSSSLHVRHAAAYDDSPSANHLVKLKECRYYAPDLDQPYATPEMKSLLELLGITFQQELSLAGLPKYKFEITEPAHTAAETHAGATLAVSAERYLHRGKSIEDKQADIAMAKALTKLRIECRCVVTRTSGGNSYIVTAVKLKN